MASKKETESAINPLVSFIGTTGLAGSIVTTSFWVLETMNSLSSDKVDNSRITTALIFAVASLILLNEKSDRHRIYAFASGMGMGIVLSTAIEGYQSIALPAGILSIGLFSIGNLVQRWLEPPKNKN